MALHELSELLESSQQETTNAKVEVTELWKFAAAIGISCAISLFGTYMTNGSNYANEMQVKEIVDSKNMLLENEMKHYNTSLNEITGLVKENTKVLHEIKEELAATRALRGK